MAKKELMIVETIKDYVDELKEFYDYVIPPKLQARIDSAIKTFFSAFSATLGLAIVDQLMKPDLLDNLGTLLKDGLWSKAVASALIALVTAGVREGIKNLRKEYDYEELDSLQNRWVDAREKIRNDL